ncbi:hypothetical protein M2459_001619 [Parabacteroides sp. PF5-5]|uniref:STM3941 family protein n=1 Tax=unclassified Parabacteroides TaxID=2649774 RepID=UPI0024769C5C|nr:MULTISPECIES: STM3941 family protein [unclassified Parabacteroides]MDH6304882.1 hypothetical protein [Parabacteroides sp. PH5-39]MDH6316032.1 hypothetical protein [Parabacteroides sp. PF5-13]MDH6319689.1 hypothetical protein [Parabacteroides sp. PH5-13]MDH6323420.1 hypothetical protein [Parabacteroides sp. PH5-8]MDH6327071.1 hypothetical protein [Parabacteroides sp. PH5-41]
MVPTLIRFTLIRRKIWGLLTLAILSSLIGCAALYLCSLLRFGGGRFLLLILGVVGLLLAFFTFFAYFHLRKERFTAMYISDEGINDISTGNRIGTVLWKDVESCKVMKELGSGSKERKYIVLKVSNPNEYIMREPSPVKRRSLELKLQYYGSPICFSNRALNCSFDDLLLAVKLKYDKYKESHIITLIN